jgi:hypothetical protein
MTSLAYVRRWWQEYSGEEETPLDGDTPAWAVSLVAHVVVLVSMASIGLPEPVEAERPIAILQPPTEENDVLLTPEPEMVISEERVEDAGAESEQSQEIAQAIAPTLAEESVVAVETEPALNSDVKLEPLDIQSTSPDTIDQTVAVKGTTGYATKGASGAVDRLTAEIRASLDQRPTAICWVFDQSVSLSAQRKEIAARLERVFEELGVDGSEKNRPDLMHVVFAYGKGVTPVTPTPTRDGAEVVAAINGIPVDDSGVENTFAAIEAAAVKGKTLRYGPPKRNIMIVAFTDEVGNDQARADEVSDFCRKQGIPVYVVGVPAPFGMRDVKMKFVEFDPKYDAAEQWAVVEQGPETLYPEVVKIFTSGRHADEAMDSGFGPFSLSKLCAETGGIYFCLHANRGASGRVSDGETAAMASRLRYFFDSDVMRHYAPDYVSAAKIDKMLAGNRAMKALVDAARTSEVGGLESPTTTFPRVDDGQLAGLLGEAQKAAAKIAPRIDALYGTLSAGLPDREKIQEKRWQAGYDLALGRILAVKVRTDAYNIMLAQAKTGMRFKDPKNDTWQLEPSDDVSAVGSQTEKLAKQAKQMLERVVNDHPGTPWAMLAGEELRTPLGYAWKEAYTGVAKRQMGGGGGNNNAPPADDKPKMLAPPKPKRPLKNL